MAALNLKMEGPEGEKVTNGTFNILRDYLQPNSSMTQESAAKAILNLLPKDSPDSTEVRTFGEMCIEIVEQIHYSHPSQIKLAALLEYLGPSKQLSGRFQDTGRFFTYGRLSESLVENIYSEIDPDAPSAHVNFHAFAANLHERRLLSTDPLWAIWMLRDAHERPLKGSQNIWDARILEAAQWILWYGQSLFKQVLSHEEPSDLRDWSPGPLYDGKATLNLDRWHFWRDGFTAVACGEKVDEKRFGQECRSVAAKAAALMDFFEKNMMF